MAGEVKVIVNVDGKEQLEKLHDTLDKLHFKTNQYSEATSEAERITKKFGEQLTHLNTRMLAHTIGISAALYSTIRFIETSQEAAEGSDRLRESLEHANITVQAGKNEWKDFHENFGAALTKFRAQTEELYQLNQIMEDVKKSWEEQNRVSKDQIEITDENVRAYSHMILEGKLLNQQRLNDIIAIKELNAATAEQTLQLQDHTKELKEHDIVKRKLLEIDDKFNEAIAKATSNLSEHGKEVFKTSAVYLALKNDADAAKESINAMANILKDKATTSINLFNLELDKTIALNKNLNQSQIDAIDKQIAYAKGIEFIKQQWNEGNLTLKETIELIQKLNESLNKMPNYGKEVRDSTGRRFLESSSGERVQINPGWSEKSDFFHNDKTSTSSRP